MNYLNDGLFFCGDIHGELKKLVWSLVYQKKITDSSVVCLGDFGVGFEKPSHMDLLYKKIEKRLEKSNITLYAIRGNHDDPDYFDGTHDYPRLKFLKDYEVVEIEGFSILPIGGATSIDQEQRKKYNNNQKRLGSSKRSWWEGERPKKVSIKDLPNKVDIIISHEAPIDFEPVVIRKTEDLDIWNSILEDRTYLGKVLKEVRARYWLHGHYHKSSSGSYGDLIYRGLAIDELFFFYKNYDDLDIGE